MLGFERWIELIALPCITVFIICNSVLLEAMDCEVKLSNDQHCLRIDTGELKHRIVRRLGQQKSQKYFTLLNRYLSFRLSKSAFNKFCIGLLGRENVPLHNGLIRAIIKNACTDKSSNCVQLHYKGKFSQSPRRGRIPKSNDWLSPLGKFHSVKGEDLALNFPEQHSGMELLSLGSRPPVEVAYVEEGEKFEQEAGSPGIYSQSSLRPPLGIHLQANATRKGLCLGSSHDPTDTCYNNGRLPDTSSLRKRLEQKVRAKKLNVSTDCANLLNHGLDVFMKQLLKSCLDLAMSRSESVINGMRLQACVQMSSVSMTDFRVAIQSNFGILGAEWPVQLERAHLHASEDYMDD